MRIDKILNVDDYYFDVFMTISEALTGFSVEELQGTGMSETYYTYVLGSMEAATFVDFLTVSKSIIDESYTAEQVRNAVAAQLVHSPDLGDITSKVITLWYMGTWDNAYVNATSYTEGLVWKVMGSHPPGAKQPGFKSWNVKPVMG